MTQHAATTDILTEQLYLIIAQNKTILKELRTMNENADRVAADIAKIIDNDAKIKTALDNVTVGVQNILTSQQALKDQITALKVAGAGATEAQLGALADTLDTIVAATGDIASEADALNTTVATA